MLVRTAFSFAFLFACISHRLEYVSLRLRGFHKIAFATATAFLGSSTLEPTASIKVKRKWLRRAHPNKDQQFFSKGYRVRGSIRLIPVTLSKISSVEIIV